MNSKQFIPKAIIAFLFFGLTTFKFVSAVTEKKVTTKVEKAIVFLHGAQLFSTSSFSIPVGITDIVFEGVSPFIDAQTLQASSTGSIIIMDVRHNVKYPELSALKEKSKPQNLKVIKAIEDSIREADWMLEELSEKREALSIEKRTLLNNRLIKGETKRDTLSLLKDALEYMRIRLANINSEYSKLKREEYGVTIIKTRLVARLTDLNEQNQRNGEINPEQKKGVINQVIVTVSSLFASTSNIDINYFVSNAGWTPSYDLRANSINTNLKLDQKASVFQSSGVDWDETTLVLSTGSPTQGNTKPELSQINLTYSLPRSYNYQGTAAPSMRNMALKSTEDTKYLDKDEALSSTAADYTVMIENPIRVDYEIKLKYTIPSDSKAHTVLIQSKEMPSNFVYSAIPKLDPNAFLVAKITDWENLNLIPGAARMYFDGAYIGSSSINMNEADDTLLLNMGRDKSIVLERKKLKDKSKEKTFNNDKIVTYVYEISIRNVKSTSIQIELEDQIPISQNEEIKVVLLESSHAELLEQTGMLKWRLNLKPKEVKKLIFSFEVRYPKNKQLAGL